MILRKFPDKVLFVKLQFVKMHGLGNDMILLDSRASGLVPTAEQVRRLADRRRGIGADQVLILLSSEIGDFRMKILNADGGEVEMCGNGIRCLAKYLRDQGLTDKRKLAIETPAGIIRPEFAGEMIRVDMGEPVFEAARIPVQGEGKLRDVTINVDDEQFKMSAVSMGNPHCVIRVEEAAAVPLEDLGPRLEHHPWFPRRTNVEFVQVLDRSRLMVRVWERGAGMTPACGTGACAAAVAMMDLGVADRQVTVSLPGGDLTICWDPQTNHVFMTGPAETVFHGTIEI